MFSHSRFGRLAQRFNPRGDCLPNNFELERNLHRSGKQSLAGLFPMSDPSYPPLSTSGESTAICDQIRHKYSKIKDNKLKNIERWQHIQLTCEKRYLVLGKIKKVHSES
jgi:hypothetical protein